MEQSVIPIGLREAALDSPSFRSVALHFFDQLELAERWLRAYVDALGNLSREFAVLDNTFNNFLSSSAAPSHISEAIIDHDYALLAVKRFGEGFRDYWNSSFGGFRRLETNMAEPIRSFLTNEIMPFKETRRQLDQAQKTLDSTQLRYSALGKSKEPSSLREEAFQLHEARRTYLKLSMDFCVTAPLLRAGLDKLIIKVFADQWRDIRTSKEMTTGSFSKSSADLDRLRGWMNEMETSEKTFRLELQFARKQVEEQAEVGFRPSRELEDYAAGSGTGSGAKGLSLNTQSDPNKVKGPRGERQGWLNMKTITGKPSRTVWVRRWFFVRNGVFGWLVQGSRSGGVEESERLGVLLCAVRQASQEERRFCFEVKTKDLTIVLQSETQQELLDWVAIFEVAKQKALEDPASTENSSVDRGKQLVDSAFAISQPNAPEFAASAYDAGFQLSEDHSAAGIERSGTLLPPGSDAAGAGFRRSFDVGAAARRPTVGERDGESGRDQAARIIQKLDIVRKGGSTPLLGGTSPNVPAGSASPSMGIAGLISASHMALPGGPGPVPTPVIADSQHNRGMQVSLIQKLPPSSLAPSTLALFPSPTNLSASAVAVSGDSEAEGKLIDSSAGLPSGMMANLWGTSTWGIFNRLDGGTATNSRNRSPLRSRPSSPNQRPPLTPLGEDRTFSVPVLDPQARVRSSSAAPSPTTHRKTVSLDTRAAEVQRSLIKPPEYPNYYPAQLKLQDTQFRLLFPTIEHNEKVLLVFKAMWGPDEQHEFPGRCYVTPRELYFYSNHLGLILTTGISLTSVSEVTAAPGRDCDFLFFHLKELGDGTEYKRMTIKSFLEPLSLLQKRLNLLVHNASSDEPQDIESVLKILIKLETDGSTRRSSVESWDSAYGGRSPIVRNASQRSNQDLRPKIFVNAGPYSTLKEPAARIKLPSQPVEYIPRGMSKCAVSKTFNISPKALFHVMFGDKSAVWQLLYHERRAQRILQGPWSRSGGDQSQTHLRRTFGYQIEYLDLLRRTRQASIVDTQMIDVLNDHLCYVVTDRKTPWHLPYYSYYGLVTKVVITHVAKSKCKLAIFIKVDWAKFPRLAKHMIEQQALSDMELDALDLADVIADQVRKLGAASRTKKAIQIFGGVGVQKQTTEFGAFETQIDSQVRRTMGHRTLTHLICGKVVSYFESFVTQIMMMVGGSLRWVWKTGSANLIILLLLGASILANLVVSGQGSARWWNDRNARNYMKGLGIDGKMVINRGISLTDLDVAGLGAANATGVLSGSKGQHGACFESFQSQTDPDNSLSSSLSYASPSPYTISSSTSPTTLRIRCTRQNLAQNRHDLLVAMRVLNTIEKEILMVEWEDWVEAEKLKCYRMRRMLDVTEARKANDTEGEGEKANVGVMRERLEEYCGSCG